MELKSLWRCIWIWVFLRTYISYNCVITYIYITNIKFRTKRYLTNSTNLKFSATKTTSCQGKEFQIIWIIFHKVFAPIVSLLFQCITSMYSSCPFMGLSVLCPYRRIRKGHFAQLFLLDMFLSIRSMLFLFMLSCKVTRGLTVC